MSHLWTEISREVKMGLTDVSRVFAAAHMQRRDGRLNAYVVMHVVLLSDSPDSAVRMVQKGPESCVKGLSFQRFSVNSVPRAGRSTM